MSRIHLRSNTLVLWLSLSAAAVAAAVSVGCSSSSDAGGGEAGKSSGGSTSKGGSTGSDAGEPAVTEGGDDSPGDMSDPAGAGTGNTAGAATAGTGNTTGGTGGAPSGAAGAADEEAGSSGVPEVDPNADAKARALTLINGLDSDRRCTHCHQSDYSGLGLWPNITPDKTNGIGNWTDDEIKAAIHDGVNPAGDMLCSTMERFQFSPDELSDLVIYLRGLPASSKKISIKCQNL